MSDDRDPDSPSSASEPQATPSDGWNFTQPAETPAMAAAGDANVTAAKRKRGNGRGPMTTGDKIRMGVRGVGQALITSGLVILLFVVYEVWVTNIYADRKQHKEQVALSQQWEAGQDPLAPAQEKLKLDPGAQVVLPAGQGFANLYIPAFGKDFAKTIVEGVDDASLEKGPGHYPKTAIPGTGSARASRS
jgi:sortase A